MILQLGFALYPLLLAATALLWLAATKAPGVSPWAVEAAACAAVVAFAFLAGPWVFTSYYLRYAVLVLFGLVAVHSFRRATRLSGESRPAGAVKVSVAVVVLFSFLDVLAIASHFAPRESVSVSFPLASGTYAVLQGGNSVVTNPFHAMSGSRLAFDIVRLNAFGNRAGGLAPRALDKYAIFGDTVFSPCGGKVTAVRDGMPDNPPGSPDTRGASGNFVIVECAGVEILMAHLKRGSVVVGAGEAVALKQPLGNVGNSGHSLEPHLHVGATRRGVERGLIFDGEWLSANSLVASPASNAR